MNQNQIKFGLLTLPILLVVACNQEGGLTETKPLAADNLWYSVVLSEDPPLEVSLRVDIESKKMRLIQLDGASYRRLLSEDEFAELLRLTTDDRAKIYSYNDGMEAGELPPLQCEQPSDTAAAQRCNALEVARFHASASLYIKGDNPGRPYRNIALVLENPTNISLEAAEMVLFLEKMRVKTHSEGEAD